MKKNLLLTCPHHEEVIVGSNKRSYNENVGVLPPPVEFVTLGYNWYSEVPTITVPTRAIFFNT